MLYYRLRQRAANPYDKIFIKIFIANFSARKGEKLKYGDWLNFWLENYVRTNLKIKTVENYSRIIESRLIPRFGKSEISSLKTAEIQLYVTGLLKSGNLKSGGELSAGTVNLVITVMQNSIKVAKTLGLVKENIADGVKRPKVRNIRPVCFSVAEQKRIEKVVFEKKGSAFGIVICLYTGLRLGELLALTWDDVDFKRKTITVKKTCFYTAEKGRYRRVENEPKTEASKREIPVPEQVISLLRKMKRGYGGVYVISKKGKPVNPRNYQRCFATVLKRAEVSRKNFHALRHTFATRAIECGVDVKTLSEILGHRSATTTLNRYAHSLTEHKRNMMKKIGNLLKD